MTKRSIGKMILFLIITFGIYGIYWNIKFHGEVREKSGEGASTVLHILLLLFTFGIYAIVWQYKTGKRLAKVGASDNSLLYVIFCFVGLAWLNPFLMQDAANKLA